MVQDQLIKDSDSASFSDWSGCFNTMFEVIEVDQLDQGDQFDQGNQFDQGDQLDQGDQFDQDNQFNQGNQFDIFQAEQQQWIYNHEVQDQGA